jgi:hypothetical protein
MNADHHDPNRNPDSQAGQQQGLPTSPFHQAWETWNDWSMAAVMRKALQVAHQQGDQETLATFQRYPQWTKGPGPLEALAANRELVARLTGWRWQAILDARQQGHGWEKIGRTVGQSGEQARADYLDKVGGQRRLTERYPTLGFDPRWLELAEPNQADRAEQQRAELERQALAHADPGCPTDWPRDHAGRQSGQER